MRVSSVLGLPRLGLGWGAGARGAFPLSRGPVSPAGSAPAPWPQVPGRGGRVACPAPLGSPALSALLSGRDRAAATAQLWTLGGLEDLRGFPRQPLASSLLPAGGLCRACPLSGLRLSWHTGRRVSGPWHRGLAQLPGPVLLMTGFPARRGGSPRGPERQLVRATGEGQWGHATLLSPPC